MSESRVRENRTHGSIGGRWRDSHPGHDGIRTHPDTSPGLDPATPHGTVDPAAYLTDEVLMLG